MWIGYRQPELFTAHVILREKFPQNCNPKSNPNPKTKPATNHNPNPKSNRNPNPNFENTVGKYNLEKWLMLYTWLASPVAVCIAGIQTLRTQDSSDPRHFGTSTEVSVRHFGTSAEVSGHIGTSA